MAYYVEIVDFANVSRARALEAGYTPSNPVSWLAMGPTEFNGMYSGALTRKFIASAFNPPFPVGILPVIWFNPEIAKFFKSANWNGGSTWEPVLTFIELFSENVGVTGSGGYNNSGFIEGVAQVPVFLPGSPNAPNEAATKAYVDLSIAGAVGGAGSALYGDPVQNIPELRALDVSGIPDKHMRLVEDEHKIYSYDLQSSAVPDNEYIAAPLVGVGRWIATNPNVLDGGNLP